MSRNCIQCNMPIHHAPTCQHHGFDANNMVQEWQRSPLCLGEPVMRPTEATPFTIRLQRQGRALRPDSITKAKANNVREALGWLASKLEVEGLHSSTVRHAEVLATLNDDKILASFYDLIGDDRI